MSIQYDDYLFQHRDAVTKAYTWMDQNIHDNITWIFSDLYEVENMNYEICFKHDESKNLPDEYEAYDAYFYGGNKSYQVVQDFRKAWLKHIHRNPHHWQHWVLINDEPNERTVALDMSSRYIIEMICDWWAFSWIKGDLDELFSWYDAHKDYMILSDTTRKHVEYLLDAIYEKLHEEDILEHHGIKGQKWGVKNGPPYPIDKSQSGELTNAVGMRIKEVMHVELFGEPNSITQITNKKGGIDRNYYDATGRQNKQISNNDHGSRKKHNYGKHGEHAHDYIYDNSGRLINRQKRELNDQERKENGDIL